MEVATEDLTSLRETQEIDRYVKFLQDKGKHEMTVSYGWGDQTQQSRRVRSHE